MVLFMTGCTEERSYFFVNTGTGSVSSCPSDYVCEEFNSDVDVYYENNSELSDVSYERFST